MLCCHFLTILIVSRFVCHCGSLGQSGVKVPKAEKTPKPSIRYRRGVRSLAACWVSRQVCWLRLTWIAAVRKALLMEQPGMILGTFVLIFINFLTQLVCFSF